MKKVLGWYKILLSPSVFLPALPFIIYRGWRSGITAAIVHTVAFCIAFPLVMAFIDWLCKTRKEK